MNTKYVKLISLIVVVGTGVVTCINPIFPHDQFLQHLGTAAILTIPAYDLKANRLTLLSYICLCLFTLIHIIGARYVYSFVPYNEWLKSFFDTDLSTLFHTNRNHYDQFVHFSFGMLVFPYLYEIVERNLALSLTMRLIFVWISIQCISMLYELFEWVLTFVMSSNAAENYNGQQGDMWDAQKDMALALLGSTIMLTSYFIKRWCDSKWGKIISGNCNKKY